MRESNRTHSLVCSRLFVCGPLRRRTLLGCVGTVMLVVAGCGSSQEDMLLRAARRSRPTNATEQASIESDRQRQRQKAVAAQPTSSVAPAEPAITSATPEVEVPPTIEQKDELAIKPIDEREPENPLDDHQRRVRAAKNIESIAKAMMAYYNEVGGFPQSHSVSASGFATLSWRVKILPFLGYEELYNRFDFDVPWNREPNKSLLQYIPDEYVSPERFDAKTNYVLPTDRRWMFGDNRGRAPGDIEDGADNTIMLLEVNDSKAVPWTAPKDLPGIDPASDLGELREDGTFAVWANGWTVLLAKELSTKQIADALSYEAGDGQLAGTIHRDISLAKVSDASVAAAADRPTEGDSDGDRPSMAPKPIEVVAKVREPVPNAADIAKAQSRFRDIYADEIREAKTDREKSALAKNALETAKGLESDRAGMYALQSAAMRLAADAADAATLIEAVDQRIGIFEVDAYEQNVVALQDFGSSAVKHDADSVDGEELLRRSVRVIFAGIEDNDFIRASAVARIAYRYTGQQRHETIPKLINRLRLLLSTSQREYDNAIEDLRAYRDDPSNDEAAASFGRFACFIKGDWDTGLPLLTKGGPEQLQQMARLDLAGARSSREKMALGDAWWNLSDLARSGVYRQAARDRAVSWYAEAYQSLPDSLDRIHVKNRLDEAEGMDGTSPIALCLQLADELGVDLTFGLAAIANVGQQGVARRNPAGFDEYD